MLVEQTTTTAPTEDVFTETLKEKLLNQSDMISSANTGIEEKINAAISGVRSANTSTATAVTSQYDRTIGYTKEQQDRELTGVRERGAGMQTTDVAYRALVSEADKNLKDLEMRKQELILQGDANAASKIADLQLQTLQYKTKAMQDTFNNLLSVGSFGIQANQEKRAARAQSFQESSAVANIGLEYGIDTNGMTLGEAVAAAQPKASEKQRLDLARTVAEINQLNAKTREIESGSGYNLSNPMDRFTMIEFAKANPGVFIEMATKDKELISLYPEIVKQRGNEVYESAKTAFETGKTYEEVKKSVIMPTEIDQKTADMNILKAEKEYIDSVKSRVSSDKSISVGKAVFGSASYVYKDIYNELFGK